MSRGMVARWFDDQRRRMSSIDKYWQARGFFCGLSFLVLGLTACSPGPAEAIAGVPDCAAYSRALATASVPETVQRPQTAAERKAAVLKQLTNPETYAGMTEKARGPFMQVMQAQKLNELREDARNGKGDKVGDEIVDSLSRISGVTALAARMDNLYTLAKARREARKQLAKSGQKFFNAADSVDYFVVALEIGEAADDSTGADSADPSNSNISTIVGDAVTTFAADTDFVDIMGGTHDAATNVSDGIYRLSMQQQHDGWSWDEFEDGPGRMVSAHRATSPRTTDRLEIRPLFPGLGN